MTAAEEAAEKEQVPMNKETPKAEEVSTEGEATKAEKLPETWTAKKVEHWFENAASMLGINITEVENLKCLNFKGLNILKKDDWLRRSPNYGDVLFNIWQEDRGSVTKEKDEGKY